MWVISLESTFQVVHSDENTFVVGGLMSDAYTCI